MEKLLFTEDQARLLVNKPEIYYFDCNLRLIADQRDNKQFAAALYFKCKRLSTSEQTLFEQVLEEMNRIAVLWSLVSKRRELSEMSFTELLLQLKSVRNISCIVTLKGYIEENGL
jgi:hypothetical protein